MITLEKMAEEWGRCWHDQSRKYMIENFFKTYDNTSKSYVPFKLFPKQIEFLHALRNHDENITTKPRQSGITTCTAAFIACEIALASSEMPERALIVGHKLDLSRQLLQKIKEFLSQLPRWFWDFSLNNVINGEFKYHYTDPKAEEANYKRKIFITQNKDDIETCNGCVVRAVSSGEHASRGFSAPTWIVFDEAAFIENGVEVYTNTVASGATGAKVVMVSTPCGKDALYYGTYMGAKNGKNKFHITDFRWYQDPRYNKNLNWWKEIEIKGENDEVTKTIETYIEPCDKNGVVPYNVDRWDKLYAEGWKPTSPWFENQCGRFNNNKQKIAQELEVSFLGSDNNVIPLEVIAMHERYNVKEDFDNGDYVLDEKEENTWIWTPPIDGHRYIMTIDAARGDGEDSSVIVILDIDAIDEDGIPCIDQVLEYKGKIPGFQLALLAYKYGMNYNQAFAVVDCIGSSGDTCVFRLVELGYPNVYYDDPALKKYTTAMSSAREIAIFQNNEKAPGFHASSVRDSMVEQFVEALTTNILKIRSRRCITEMDTWVFKNGRADHKDGCHDDILMSLSIGLFVYRFSYVRHIKLQETQEKINNAWILNYKSTKTEVGGGAIVTIETQEKKKMIMVPFYVNNISNNDIVTDSYYGNYYHGKKSNYNNGSNNLGWLYGK